MRSRDPGRTRRDSGAWSELCTVHRLEFARLLREAAALRCRATDAGRLFVVVRVHASSPAGLRWTSPLAWRRAARRALQLAREDRIVAPAALGRALLAAWPARGRPAEPALAAWSLDPCDAGLLQVGRVLVAEDRPQEAVLVLSRLLALDPLPEVRDAAVEALSLALLAAGRIREALERLELAGPGSREGLDLAVERLSLALICNDPRALGSAAERLGRLDLGVPGARLRWQRAVRLAGERARARPQGSARRGVLDPQGRELALRLAREAVPAVAGVARELL